MFEAVCLATLTITSKIFYTNTATLVQLVGTASWYTSIFSGLVTLGFFLLIYLLMKRFPGYNMIDIFERVLGKVGLVILGLLFTAYSVFYSGTNLREFVEMIKAYNLPYTPTSVIAACVILTAILISYFGLECLARISAICFVPILAGLAAILILASPTYDFTMLRPYLGHGIDKSLYYGFLRSSAYSEIILLPLMANSIHGVRNLKKAGVISILISTVVFGVSNGCYLVSFGYPVASESLSGIFELSRSIYFNRFFQRVESIFLFIWVISSVITVSVAFYIALSIFCRTFKLNNQRPLMFPMAFLVFMVALLPRNLSEVIDINIAITRQYSLFILFFIPVLILILSVIFRKKGNKAHAQKS